MSALKDMRPRPSRASQIRPRHAGIRLLVVSTPAVPAEVEALAFLVLADPQPDSRLHDPEGNPIELWQPAGRDAPR